MSVRSKILLGTALLALFALAVRQLAGASGDKTAPAAAAAPAETVPTQAPELGVAAEVAGRDSSPSIAAQAGRPAPAALANPCVLRGRVLLPDGRPAAACRIAVEGTLFKGKQERSGTAPADWSDPAGLAEADGGFELRFDPPAVFQFALVVRAQACPAETWRWAKLEPGQIVELGTIRLAASGAIVGLLADPQGRALGAGWSVSALDPNGPGFGFQPQQSWRQSTRADAATGRFSFAEVPARQVQLAARHELGAECEPVLVDVHADLAAEARLVYAGPPTDRRIVLRYQWKHWQPLFGVWGATLPEARLSGTNVERVGVPLAQPAGSIEFGDVPPGVYTVSTQHPWLEDWSATGIAPGSLVRAEPRPSAAIVLEVVDARSGAPLPRHSVTARYAPEQLPSPRGLRAEPALVPLAPAGDRALEHELRLVPLRCDLVVQAEGYARKELLGIEPVSGGVLHLRAELVRGGSVHLAATSAGLPCEGVRAGVCPADLFALALASQDRRRPEGMDGARSAVCDAQGAATFDNLAAGAWIAYIQTTPHLRAKSEFTIVDGAEPTTVVLELPPNGRLEGRVLGMSQAMIGQCVVVARPAELDRLQARAAERAAWFDAAGKPLLAAMSADGAFTMARLPAGEVVVELMVGERLPQELGRVHILAGAVTRQEFEARAALPGTIAAHILLDGKPAARSPVNFVQTHESAGAATDLRLDDEGRLEAVLPAGEYRVALHAADGAWQTVSTRSWTLEPGARLELAHEFALVEGVVQFVDEEDGRPLPGLELVLLGPTGVATRASTTDDEGRLRATLPPGVWSVHFARGGDRSTLDDRFAGRLEWTARGPSIDRLRVKRR